MNVANVTSRSMASTNVFDCLLKRASQDATLPASSARFVSCCRAATEDVREAEGGASALGRAYSTRVPDKGSAGNLVSSGTLDISSCRHRTFSSWLLSADMTEHAPIQTVRHCRHVMIGSPAMSSLPESNHRLSKREICIAGMSKKALRWTRHLKFALLRLSNWLLIGRVQRNIQRVLPDITVVTC